MNGKLGRFLAVLLTERRLGEPVFCLSFPIRTLLFVFVAYTWFARPAQAGIVYSQVVPTPPTGAFSSNDAGNATDQKIADGFQLNGISSVTIRSLRFIG